MKPRSGNGGMRGSDISQELLTKLKERDAYRREVRRKFRAPEPRFVVPRLGFPMMARCGVLGTESPYMR